MEAKGLWQSGQVSQKEGKSFEAKSLLCEDHRQTQKQFLGRKPQVQRGPEWEIWRQWGTLNTPGMYIVF